MEWSKNALGERHGDAERETQRDITLSQGVNLEIMNA